MHVLNYHHPQDNQYSLYFLSDVKKDRDKKAIELAKRSNIKFIDETDAVDGEEVYLLYTKNAPDSVIPEFESHEAAVEWLEDQFTDAEIQIVDLIMEILGEILTEKEERDETFLTYKQMNLEKVPEILNRVEWRQQVDKVAAELLSSFILAHPMPNTNHRTGIVLIDSYLQTMDSDFVMPDTGEENEWYPWAVNFIHDSKRFLTLRRNLPKLEWAYKLGYEAVVRKEGVEIDLTTIDFDRSNYFDYYTERHLSRSRAFVQTVLEEADATHLQQETDDGKRAFVDRVKLAGR